MSSNIGTSGGAKKEKSPEGGGDKNGVKGKGLLIGGDEKIGGRRNNGGVGNVVTGGGVGSS